ncbi:MAG: phosphoribosylaminoimidazolecarboxamide formyltransferase [Oscillospiraceae bacterium]|nr:phosphoribosylaminoimidazolecarboxamide formyltransferase [Oscillospiraceae bacterium]
MKELALKYGCNPNQVPARVFTTSGELPFEVLCGRPGYINLLDALNSWQLVRELKRVCSLPAAASFKHLSPAGAAFGLPLDSTLKKMYFAEKLPLSPLACAYARARGADRLSSFGDWTALSDICDFETASLIRHEVSDGVIAPGYTAEALALLKEKRGGSYNIIEIDPLYDPPEREVREVFGLSFEQRRNDCLIDEGALSNIVTANKALSEEQKRDLLLCLVSLKYTQSNSVCYAANGQLIGVGAGQQSRVHCTRLAGDKADRWQLRRHPKALALPFREGLGRPERDNAVDIYLSVESGELLEGDNWRAVFSERPEPLSDAEKREWLGSVSGVSLGSDAFFPFADNIERARRSGVSAIVQPGGSVRDGEVIAACDHYGIAMAFCGMRLFHH